MRLLLDTCVWGRAAAELEALGHEVEWTGTWQQDPGDSEIMRLASARYAVLVTLDKDFGELAIVRGIEHSGIVRLVGIEARNQGSVTARVLDRYGDELAAGAIVTVTSQRVRIRPAEGQ